MSAPSANQRSRTHRAAHARAVAAAGPRRRDRRTAKAKGAATHARPPEALSARLIAIAAQLVGDELAVLTLVAERLLQGRQRYGELRVATDPRDFAREAIEEAADGLVYAAAALVSLRPRDNWREWPIEAKRGLLRRLEQIATSGSARPAKSKDGD